MEDTGNHQCTTIGNSDFVFTAHKMADIINVDPLKKSIELRYCKYYCEWHKKNIPQRTFILNFNMDIITKYNPREENNPMQIKYATEFKSNTSTCEKLKVVHDNYYFSEKLSNYYRNFNDFPDLHGFANDKREYYCSAGQYRLSLFGGRIYVVSID